VFDFIGRANCLEGDVADGHFTANGQSLRLSNGNAGVSSGRARLYVRPHDLAVGVAGQGWPARVVATHRLADRLTLELQVEGQAKPLELDLPASPDVETPTPGSVIGVMPLRYRIYPA
jgi:sulfate transport system ATP-binding protein